MKCSKCNKDAIPDVEYAGKKYCKHHFLELMEKRVRKNLRTRELINPKKKYIMIDDGSCEAKLTEYFINKIFEGRLNITINTKVKTQPKKQSEHIIVPTNLDEQALLFLGEFLANHENDVNEEPVMPLEVLTQREVELLCQVLTIPFRARISKDMLHSLEMRHPSIKYSLFQSKMNVARKKK